MKVKEIFLFSIPPMAKKVSKFIGRLKNDYTTFAGIGYLDFFDR
jgi:hypothetical protein